MSRKGGCFSHFNGNENTAESKVKLISVKFQFWRIFKMMRHKKKAVLVILMAMKIRPNPK